MKPQGRHGEVAVELFTSFPERFEDRRDVSVVEASGTRRAMRVEEFWSHKGRMILKFAGVDTIDAAESLAGCDVQIRKSERVALPEDEQYVSDLVGCRVTVEAREVGTVEDVTFGAGEAPLLVIRDGKREHLVPFANEYVVKLDVGAKRMELRLPDGMLELDAPLNAEEKQRMHRK